MTKPLALRRLEVLRDAMPDTPARDVLAASIDDLADLIQSLTAAANEAAETADYYAPRSIYGVPIRAGAAGTFTYQAGEATSNIRPSIYDVTIRQPNEAQQAIDAALGAAVRKLPPGTMLRHCTDCAPGIEWWHVRKEQGDGIFYFGGLTPEAALTYWEEAQPCKP